MTMIFLNLPTTDLDKGSAFFSALGWERSAQFSDDTAASHMIDENIVVILLTQEKFTSFIGENAIAPRSAGVPALYALSAESREGVDELADKALAVGGGEWQPAQDYGFMYGRSFTDPDGHVFEVIWMDPAVLAGGEMPQTATA